MTGRLLVLLAAVCLPLAAALLVLGIFGAGLVADHRVGAASGEAAEAQAVFPASGSSR